MEGLALLVQWWDWQEGGGEEKVALHTWGGGAAATRTSLPALRAPHCLLQLRCSLSEGVLLKIKAARAGIAHQEEKKSKYAVHILQCVFGLVWFLGGFLKYL